MKNGVTIGINLIDLNFLFFAGILMENIIKSINFFLYLQQKYIFKSYTFFEADLHFHLDQSCFVRNEISDVGLKEKGNRNKQSNVMRNLLYGNIFIKDQVYLELKMKE